MKRNSLITVIAMLAVAAFASIQGTRCFADDPLAIFIGEGSYDGPLVRVAPSQAPLSVSYDSVLSAVSVTFRENMENALVQVQNTSTGEIVWTVSRAAKGTVARVPISGASGSYRVVIRPCAKPVEYEAQIYIY